MSKNSLIVRCELCGHIEEVLSNDDLDNLTCSDCGYNMFTVVQDNTKEDPPVDDQRLEISEEPKDCIIYMLSWDGEPMVISKKSKFVYHRIDKITPDMRLYTWSAAHAARDAMLKKNPNWKLKIKQFT